MSADRAADPGGAAHIYIVDGTRTVDADLSHAPAENHAFGLHEISDALLRVCAIKASSRLMVCRRTFVPPTILPVTANHSVVKGRI